MNELAISIAVNILLGLILLVLLVWKRVGDTARLADSAEAVAHYDRHFPGAVGNATLSDDACGALIDLQRGGIGLLQRQGRRWNARQLRPGEVSSVELDGEIIKLKFADFGWPRAQMRLADAGARAQWLGRLRSLGDA
jgi:hypothetical protein